ncbi:MAG TPA: NBR1-Ig-like domain-containing protein [Anaerolineales bacterium]|nr:NBR1-Ig-like domain-containing protein [Anaerolineales bacterium]
MMTGALLLASCGAAVPELTPTVTFNADDVRTQAVGTFSADLTQTALAAPTDTPTATPTLPTLATLPASTASTPFGAATVAGAAPTSVTSCYGLTFVSDVTIPDNTQMTPGKAFTKTWKVLNAGSCAWEAGFKFGLTGGEAMGSSPLTLQSSVAAGAQFDLSVPMTAPNTPGTYRGNWRMSTASGQFFGDEVYVVIVVGGGAAATSTGAAATAIPTATPTQP